jgi:hypothetical protein
LEFALLSLSVERGLHPTRHSPIDQTGVAFNTATSGYGGGILVLGSAQAYIGSPSYGAAGVVNNNTAAHGGGGAVFANHGDSNDAVVKLFTTDPERPVSLQSFTEN